MLKRFSTTSTLILTLFISTMIHAQTNPNGWDQGLAVAQAHQNDAENTVKNGNPNDIPGYESNPSQTQYYGGVTEDDSSQMQSDAVSAANSSEEGQAIVNSFNNRDMVTVDPNSESMKKSEAIENDPSSSMDTNSYCMDGNCTDKSYTQSDSFNDAMSALNADADAESYENPTSIFNGRSTSCHKDGGGYSNCCKDSGWGKDIGLAHCSEEEKELGQSKEDGLAVYVGEYCSKKVLGVCTQHKQGYCVFQSTTAYIMQTQGRHDQLGIGFGSGKHPDCRGLTADELSKIDQSKIDWSSFYNTQLNPNQPDMGADQARIEQEINGLENSGTAHD